MGDAMKYTVLVLSKTDPNGWWTNTILERGDFAVRFIRNPDQGFRAIARGPCDLFIIEDWPRDPRLPRRLEGLRCDLRTFVMAGLVITAVPDPALLGEPVQAVLTAPFNPEGLNDAIARTLGLPSRVQDRHPMRMTAGWRGRSSKPDESVITININSGGMLVESLRPLEVGKRYSWHFGGPESLEGLSIPGRILRTVPASGGTRKYMIQFDRSAQEARQRLGHYLAENC
jgi:hypothetical protein